MILSCFDSVAGTKGKPLVRGPYSSVGVWVDNILVRHLRPLYVGADYSLSQCGEGMSGELIKDSLSHNIRITPGSVGCGHTKAPQKCECDVFHDRPLAPSPLFFPQPPAPAPFYPDLLRFIQQPCYKGLHFV